MSEHNDGGPAFPQPINFDGERRDFPCEFGLGGMALRDYFAAKALPALISAMMDRRHEADFANFDSSAIAEATRLAYEAADAALHWRES